MSPSHLELAICRLALRTPLIMVEVGPMLGRGLAAGGSNDGAAMAMSGAAMAMVWAGILEGGATTSGATIFGAGMRGGTAGTAAGGNSSVAAGSLG